jgi:hypothetical protein
MSAETAGVDSVAPNLNLNAEEKRVYGQLFRQADLEGVGVVTGETAVKFFEKTRLDSRILGEVRALSFRTRPFQSISIPFASRLPFPSDC